MKHLLYLLMLCLLSCSDNEPTYDTIIRNGTVYDGTGTPGVATGIGIIADTIAAIGPNLGKARRVIDARGMAVAPGFINMLSWANKTLLVDGRGQSDLRQGVTLEVMGEGSSMGPLNETMKKAMAEDQGDLQFDVAWNTLGEYLQHLEDRGVSMNVASFVGNATLRKHVIGYEDRPATATEMEAMKQLLAEAMEEGAVGVSSSLIYAPSMNADTEELTELAKVAADYNGMYISHIRNEGDRLLEAVEELVTICRESGARSEIYHLKASGQQNWGKMDSVFRRIEELRAADVPITADMYTYNASSTGLHVQLPDWVRRAGIPEMLRRLEDPAIRDRVLKEFSFRNPPETILIVGFNRKDLRDKYAGRRISQVAEEMGLSPKETVIELMRRDQSRIQVAYFSMSEENVERKIAKPWMSFCSDSGAYTNEGVFLESSTHPRAYGSIIRVLGHFCRDKKLFPLEDGIRRLTSLPAENLRLDRRGKLAPGYFADVVVFDPETVDDRATFEEPHQYAVGVEYVLVNGELALAEGEVTEARPGRFVKGPGVRPTTRRGRPGN